MEAVYISADLGHVWMALRAPDEARLHEALATLPLHRFMDLTITPLLDA